MTLSPHRGATSAPENLSALVERVDFIQLVTRYSGQGRASGRIVTFSCPNPAHADAHPSFTVTTNSKGRQVGKCFSQCDWQGDALELVKWLEGLSTGEAASWLRRYLGEPDTVVIYRKPQAPRKQLRKITPRDNAQRLAPERAEWLLEKYLVARSWPVEVVERFGLEAVLDEFGAERIRHPYFTPTRSGEWEVSYWQDRGTKSSPVKWLSPKGSTPALFNLRSLEADSLEGVVITEGAADAITATLALEGCERVAVVGVPGVSAWRPEWAPLMSGLRVVVAADNDSAGQRLEEAVRSSMAQPVALVRPTHGDLTDTAIKSGLESLRALLLSALATQDEATPRTLAESVALLLAYFPGGTLLEGANS